MKRKNIKIKKINCASNGLVKDLHRCGYCGYPLNTVNYCNSCDRLFINKTTQK